MTRIGDTEQRRPAAAMPHLAAAAGAYSATGRRGGGPVFLRPLAAALLVVAAGLMVWGLVLIFSGSDPDGARSAAPAPVTAGPSSQPAQPASQIVVGGAPLTALPPAAPVHVVQG